MKPQACVVGGSTWDVLFTASQADLLLPKGRAEQPVLAFPYGGKVDAVNVVYGFGGGAANVSVSLAGLGVRVGITSRIGDDWRGDEVIKNLRRRGVSIDNVQRDKRETTPLAFIVTAGGAHDHVAFVSRGAAKNFVVPTQVNKNYRWLYLTALASPQWYKNTRGLFASAWSREQKIFWNPGAAQLQEPGKVRSLLKYVTVLDVNDDEARLLASKLRLRAKRPAELARALVAAGAAASLITCGRDGAYLFDGRKTYFRAACRVKPINTTGAGDAFGSGWLAGYMSSGGNAKVAMDWGMYNASSVITHIGAQRGILSLKGLASFRKKYG